MNSIRTTNMLLGIIALALLLNLSSPWIQPQTSVAAAGQIDEFYLMGIEASLGSITSNLSSIESDVSVIRMQMMTR